jgi:hypothetical protein
MKLQNTLIYVLSVLIIGLVITTIIVFLLSYNKQQIAKVDYSIKPTSKVVDNSIKKVYVAEDHISSEEATLNQQVMRRGPKPRTYTKGDGSLVDAYFRQTFFDYEAMQVLDAGSIFEVGNDAWGLRVKTRGKNRLGAYTISATYIVIKNNIIINSEEVY